MLPLERLLLDRLLDLLLLDDFDDLDESELPELDRLPNRASAVPGTSDSVKAASRQASRGLSVRIVRLPSALPGSRTAEVAKGYPAGRAARSASRGLETIDRKSQPDAEPRIPAWEA